MATMQDDINREEDRMRADNSTAKMEQWAEENLPRRGPGRPATGRHPARMLGRISQAEWQQMKTAAAESGKSFTAWAKEILLRHSEG